VTIKAPNSISIALETNGEGYIGYIVELPGAYVRGKNKEEAIGKTKNEVISYIKWLGIEPDWPNDVKIVQIHQSSLTVEDADNEILLDADRENPSKNEFDELCRLVIKSGETFIQIYNDAEFKDWIDETKIRKTFYGDNPASIKQIYEHVNNCQLYYLSRLKIDNDSEGDFLTLRMFCLERLKNFYDSADNSRVINMDNELWTLKKVLRRFIWHDRIHSRAMMRILGKQKQIGIINQYDDPFYFEGSLARLGG
jgi:hypothetical protein